LPNRLRHLIQPFPISQQGDEFHGAGKLYGVRAGSAERLQFAGADEDGDIVVGAV